MKLRNKIIILISLLTAAFLGLNYLNAIRYPFITYSAITILFSLSIFASMHFFVTRRIEKLNKKIANVSRKDALSHHVKFTGDDEIAGIAKSINQILNVNTTSRNHLKRLVDEKNQEIERANNFLKQEISQRTSAESKLLQHKEYRHQIAHYDHLTSLPNRVVFNEILDKAINHAKRRNKLLAILSINIDEFMKVNQKIGNVKSDQVLKELSKRFENVLRSEDVIAKSDGDEFIVLLNDISKAKFASTVARKLLQVCSHPMKIDDYEFSLTASIGVSVFPNDGNSLEELLKSVELALYKAKHAGGANYQFHTSEMDIEAHAYIQLESDLRKAMHSNELVLYYQPKLNIKTGTVNSIEALIRWEHPQLGIIYPAEFMPVAEDAGLSLQIGEWVLREACKMNKHWQNEGYEHLSVAVNLSSKQFHHVEMAKLIEKILKDTQLHPQYLELEITENVVMDNAESAISILQKLKATGVQLSLDHFGMGYTSISYLKQFPISILKMDQNFIKGIPNNPNDSAITSAVIALAHNLGLKVIAEGVESAEQVEFLASHDCDMLQGYFLSHPLPANKIVLQFKKLREEVLI